MPLKKDIFYEQIGVLPGAAYQISAQRYQTAASEHSIYLSGSKVRDSNTALKVRVERKSPQGFSGHKGN
jgi:hypothetical protein